MKEDWGGGGSRGRIKIEVVCKKEGEMKGKEGGKQEDDWTGVKRRNISCQN